MIALLCLRSSIDKLCINSTLIDPKYILRGYRDLVQQNVTAEYTSPFKNPLLNFSLHCRIFDKHFTAKYDGFFLTSPIMKLFTKGLSTVLRNLAVNSKFVLNSLNDSLYTL